MAWCFNLFSNWTARTFTVRSLMPVDFWPLMTITGRLLWRHLLSECRCRASLKCFSSMRFRSCNNRLSPYIIQTVLGAVSVAGTLPALYFIETWGRRKVYLLPLGDLSRNLLFFPQSLLLGASGQSVCALIVSAPYPLANSAGLIVLLGCCGRAHYPCVYWNTNFSAYCS
jgi:hypothetical protein